MFAVLEKISAILWGPWTPFALLGAGIVFTIATKFSQYKILTHGVAVVRGDYDADDDTGAISHFQALAAALSATIGLGNIGGVALAIGVGGPGALFWMWVVGLLGMSLKAVEITLAMLYRNTDDPENPSGGAMWVIRETLGKRGPNAHKLAVFLGGLFSVTLVISTITGGNVFQAWNVARLTETYFHVPQMLSTVVMASVVAMVIIGGIKRIGSVAAAIVPIMCVLYVVAGLAVIAANIGAVPGVLRLVVTSAFSPTEANGAFVGAGLYFVFSVGLKRALFSNEAGQGSAPIAHAAAKTGDPAREGIVGGLGPFIDTIVICTLTALVILVTGTWNRDSIGSIDGDVVVSAAVDAEGAEIADAWDVTAPTNIEALPPRGDGDWGPGDGIFILAETDGVRLSANGGTSRVQLTGTVVRGDADNPELTVAWSPLELDRSRWRDQPSVITPLPDEVHRTLDGAQLTAHAFDRAFPGLGKWLVTLAAWLFAISTMISWSYYGEKGVTFLVGERGSLPYKMVFLVCAAIAPVLAADADRLITIIDFGTGAMLWGNLPIVFLTGYLAVRAINQYFARLKAGEFTRRDRSA